MGLGSLAGTFREHFGSAGNEMTRFSLDQFMLNFQKIFIDCKSNKIELHNDFIPFGVMLLSLYETLEKLDAAVNVKVCYQIGQNQCESR